MSRSVTPIPATSPSTQKNGRLQLTNVFVHECGTYSRQNTSVSVSWSSTGQILASSSHAGAKLWPTDALTTSASSSASSSSTAALREIATLHHTAPVDRVRFHPTDSSLLSTSAEDRTVQLWDIRAKPQRCLAKIPIGLGTGLGSGSSSRGKCASSAEWQGGAGHHLVITEKDNSVHVHDVRKLQNSGGGGGGNKNKAKAYSEVKAFQFDSDNVLAETHFSPSGTHLISSARRIRDGMGILHVYPLESAGSTTATLPSSSSSTFVGHTGPIYSLRFSPCGNHLATGGNDALVGIWDVRTMVCRATIAQRTKFIRSVAFSHDSKILACCSEEKGIDLSDVNTGESIANVNVSVSSDRDRGRSIGMGMGMTMGADEIAFHPKAHVIACARGEHIVGSVPQVSIARFSFG